MTRLKKEVKPSQERKICVKCNKDKLLKDFYTADETFHPDSRYHLCKICVEEIIDVKGFNGFLSILRQLNKPFIQEKYKGDWKAYLTQISSLPQYKGMTFDNSIFENININKNMTIQQEPSTVIDSINEDSEMYELASFWGKGLDIEDLEYLQNEYDKLINSYECDSYAMELLFQEAAQQRLTIKKLRASGKSVDKELKTLQDLLGSANIKPVQETGANATEQATFGTLIKKYENERPIPEPDEAWKDVDGIKKYIQVWFLGHLCKMIGINNDYSKMYEEELARHTVETPEYVEDSDEGVEK